MSRADAKKNKQQRRAREDLTRGMRRGDLGLALEGYLGIPDREAGAELDEARRWFERELRAALATGQKPALDPWLKIGAPLPALLVRLGLDDDELRWSLLWAAAGAEQWKPAELLLGELEPRLRERAAPLAEALSAYVAARGTLTLEQIPACLRAPESDQRLGGNVLRQTPRRSNAGAPPASATDAERDLIECYACEPFGQFSALAQRWLRAKAAEPVAGAISVAVAELAALELLRGLELGSGGAHFSVVELMLAAVSAAPRLAHAERERCERALLLALRVVLGALTERGRPRPPAGLIASTVRLALGAPALQGSVTAALTEIAGSDAADLPAQLLCELHGSSPTPLLWVRAALALDHEEQRRYQDGHMPRRTSSEWLERTLAAHLADPDAVQRAFAALPSKRRESLLSVLSSAVPPRLVGDVFDALWPAASDAQRRELATFAHDALESNTEVSFCSECSDPHGRPFEALSDLSSAGKVLYERVAPRLQSRDERFLALALEHTDKRSERRDLLLAFAHDAASIDQHVAAIERARSAGLSQKPFRERLRARFQGRLAPLARGLDLAVDRLGVRSSTARELAEALLEAATSPLSERSDHLQRQLRLARRIHGRARQRRSRQGAVSLTEARS